MIKVHKGNVLEEVNYGVIVHGCNTQGVMGGGIALQIRQKWPKVYEGYLQICKANLAAGRDLLGDVLFIPVKQYDNLIIANAFTQKYFGTDQRHVNYDAVAKCFEAVKKFYPDKPIHFPMIGAGLAGGNWNIIQKIIEEEASGCDLNLWILK